MVDEMLDLEQNEYSLLQPPDEKTTSNPSLPLRELVPLLRVSSQKLKRQTLSTIPWAPIAEQTLHFYSPETTNIFS
jgi:hypothetical protein